MSSCFDNDYINIWWKRYVSQVISFLSTYTTQYQKQFYQILDLRKSSNFYLLYFCVSLLFWKILGIFTFDFSKLQIRSNLLSETTLKTDNQSVLIPINLENFNFYYCLNKHFFDICTNYRYINLKLTKKKN